MRTRFLNTGGMAYCWGATALALVLFLLLFMSPALGFWRQMTVTTLMLAALGGPGLPAEFRAFRTSRGRYLMQAVVLGLASAALLYGIFAAGKWLLLGLHPGSGTALQAIYTMDETVAGWRVALLLLLVIGPCEEIFWRGLVQRRLSAMYGWKGVAMAAGFYTLGHVASGNPVLILAAAVCGAFWGIQYFLSRNLLLNIVSHSVWTTTAFSLAPFS